VREREISRGQCWDCATQGLKAGIDGERGRWRDGRRSEGEREGGIGGMEVEIKRKIHTLCWTVGTGQPWQGSQDRTAGTKPEQDSLNRPVGTGQSGQVSRDRSVGTGQSGQVSRDRSVGTGQSGSGSKWILIRCPTKTFLENDHEKLKILPTNEHCFLFRHFWLNSAKIHQYFHKKIFG
jgi:hypothetical protein